ncbi:MAG TPA: T9SS type A sorting domain-containing protein [Bacteroidia bacterium]|nr:T9SS type A sorting domain-containing protein [Bacteroidia bacterium]
MRKLFLCAFFFVIFIDAFSQINPALLTKNVYSPQVSQVRLLGKTKALKYTQPILSSRPSKKLKHAREIFNEKEYNPSINPNALPSGKDPLLNRVPVRTNQDIDTIFTIEGLSDPNVYPPDPCGEIGKNEYIQMTNGGNGTLFQIFDKQGVSLYGPATCNTFWTQFGTTGLGDPIVMYDESADRWMISELSISFSDVLIAISETSDPLGNYYVYDFQTPGLPDYPKYFIWHDAYYFCSNEGSGGSPIYALNRSDMLNGVQTTQLLRWTVPGFSALGFQLASGADWEGSIPPPIGSPAYILRMYDDAWSGGTDHLEIWELSVNWSNPGSSVLTGPSNLNVTAFDSDVCPGYCAPQPSGGSIDVIQQILMHRVQYRNFGTYESMVCNHVIDPDGTGNSSGIRWYELRKDGTNPWSVYQEGTVSPDADYRFMGSIAQDANGHIALGYSVSSSSIYPSLRIIARNPSDPPGQMTYNEVQIATGLGGFGGGRWGDYSEMSTDPVETGTFWFTGEYMGQFEWATRIVKFEMSKDSNELAMNQIISPVSAGGLTSAETVKVRITNNGSQSQSNFQVHYRVDLGTVVTETIAATLLPDSSIDYSFVTPADLSVVGQTYSIQAYTSLPNDANRQNDTLRADVTHLVDLDNNLLSVEGLTVQSCGSSKDIRFIVRNDGATAITSMDLNYILNGNPVVTHNQVASLITGQTDTFTVTVNSINNGSNSITIFVSNPNGQPDQLHSNDTIHASITGINPGITVTLELKTDDYPEETSWDLMDASGTVIQSGGNFTNAQSIYTQDFCMEDTCYTFVIYDTYGDGFNFGTPGYFKLIRSDGVILSTNTLTDFGYSESHLFCADFQCTLSATSNVVDASAAGVSDGSILANPNGGAAPFEYSLNGAPFVSGNFFSSLLPGTYQLIVRDLNHCSDTLQAIVGIQIGVNQITSDPVKIHVAPNPVEEFIKLGVDGISGPAQLQIQITDLQGKVVKNGTIPKYGTAYTGTIVFEDKAPGVYFIRLVNVSYPKLIRFVKN